MKASLLGLVSGVMFGVGLVLSGMAQPAKVIGFLDVTGRWDPSLALVMVGAIAVYAPSYRWFSARSISATVREALALSSRRLDVPLLLGAAIFGVGWGLSGYCPGPGMVAAGTGAMSGLTFLVGMVAGMGLHVGYGRALSLRQPERSGSDAVRT
jgi:uncharacterized membrane protein YedE/YeeE